MKKNNFKTISLFVISIGALSSFFGVILSSILSYFNIFNSVNFFLNLPLYLQIIACVFYVFLWILLFFVLYKELN